MELDELVAVKAEAEESVAAAEFPARRGARAGTGRAAAGDRSLVYRLREPFAMLLA